MTVCPRSTASKRQAGSFLRAVPRTRIGRSRAIVGQSDLECPRLSSSFPPQLAAGVDSRPGGAALPRGDPGEAELAVGRKIGETARRPSACSGARSSEGSIPQSATGLALSLALRPGRGRRRRARAARIPRADERATASGSTTASRSGETATPRRFRQHALNGVTQLGSIYVVIGSRSCSAVVELLPDGRPVDRAVHRRGRGRRGDRRDGDQGHRRSGATGVQPRGCDARPVVPERSHDDRGGVLRGRRALLLGRRRPRAARAVLAGGAVGIAVAVAASRVLLDVHWLTDVIGGLALGWAWFALCSIAFGGRLLRFGVVAEVAEQVADPTRPAGERLRSGRRRRSSGRRAHRRRAMASVDPPSRRDSAARVAASGNRAGGAVVRQPGEPADLPASRAAASPARLGTRARSAAGGWAARPPYPPRSGNAVEVLIDGAEALPRDRRGDAARPGRTSISPGWYFSPDRSRSSATATRVGAPRPARRARRADRRAGARSGRAHRCRSSGRRAPTSARCATGSSTGHAIAGARSTHRSGRCTATTRRRS